MKFQKKYHIELEGLNLKHTWICNKKVMIAGEARITGFFLFKQVSPNGYNMKMEEGFESKGNKG